MRKILLVVLLGGALAVALLIWRRPSASEHLPPSLAGSNGATASVPRTAPGPGSAEGPARPGEAPPGQVRRLTSDERRRLGEQIAAARQRARAAEPSTAAGSATDSADDDHIPVEQVTKPLKDGLNEAIHLLAECYQQQPGGDAMREAAALMTMTTDPELGTVIDTDEIKDAAGNSVAPKLDECLRDTIDSLALPPLGKRGKLTVKYTFRFD